MSNLLKHANYLNAVLKSLKTRGLTWVPRQKLSRSNARHVNSKTEEPMSGTLFRSYYSFDGSEKFRTFIYFNFGVFLQEN